MFGIYGFLTFMSKMPNNLNQFSQIVKYLIYTLTKAQHYITQIANLHVRDKSTISRELYRNIRCRGYRAKHAYEIAYKCFDSSRNASTLLPLFKEQASELLRL
jgi:IS30 family transposase